ncbi:YD repeat-containing protein [Tenacibaculum lutimaris]|uniref:YD repeat-containing protein n=1 Tax=Tenacibaculum lutimaris TaxID=285258 RepID=A0A420E197_9FLAO|nr:hypothetical protein [Tenacibaculum lutimaris]RKF03673.1 YD repeat-containing protein [Tenacibaculum lutimaris]
MKLILLLLTTVMFVNCANTIERTTLEKKNLKGKVKSLHFKVFEVIETDEELRKGEEQSGLFFGNNMTKFDKRGYETEYIVFKNNGDIDYHLTYNYNKQGLITEEIEFYSDGEIKGKTSFNYTKKNDSILVTKNNSNYGIKNYNIKYDENKNLIFDGRTFKYDKNNNLIKEITEYDTTTREYDADGNMIKKIYKGTITTIISEFKYTDFDKMGNWVKQIEFRKGKARFICERKIEYY